MTNIKYISDCCQAEVRVEGDPSELGGTCYYVCEECDRACDAHRIHINNKEKTD